MALEDARDDDPIAGWLVGENELVCRLTSRHHLALRPGGQFVVLERLELEHAGLHDLQQHAELVVQLSHPHLAKVFGLHSGDEGTFWITELVPGATLKELRAACKKAGKSLPLGLIFAAVHEAALALGELHGRRRAHGDVRDSNLIVGFNGASKLVNPGVLDSIQRLPPDPQTDVFALCNLLYQCLTGQGTAGPAFAAPSTFNHALEKPVDDLMLRALGPDRARRFKTGAELAQALKSAAGAYMWKPAQRAEFVASLFRTRKQRSDQVLYSASARLAELRAAKAAEKAATEAAAAHAVFMNDEAARKEAAALDFEIDEQPPTELADLPVIYSVPRRAVMLGAAAIFGVIACVTLVRLITSDPAGAATHVAVLAPPIPVLVPVAPAEPAPAPIIDPAAQLATADEPAAQPEAAQPERPKVKHKKKASSSGEGDAPLPPWLMRKGRR